MIDRQSHKISPSQCMQTLQQCEVLSLDDAVCSLFQQIADAALNARLEAFGSLLLPYLGLLLAHLRKGPSCSILTNDCRDHVHLILQAYIIRYICPEPRRPADWSRRARTVRCGCRDCLELKAFVKDGTRETCQFRMVQARRKHLQGQVPRTDYRCETITSGSPHALVITKIHTKYLQEHAQWQDRFDRARACIRNLDSNPWLKQLLGDKHDEIVNLKVTHRPLPTVSSYPSRINKPSAEQAFGNKRKEPESKDDGAADQTKRRKIAVIDLTSDQVRSEMHPEERWYRDNHDQERHVLRSLVVSNKETGVGLIDQRYRACFVDPGAGKGCTADLR